MNFATSQHGGGVCCAFAPQLVIVDCDHASLYIFWFFRSLRSLGISRSTSRIFMKLGTDVQHLCKTSRLTNLTLEVKVKIHGRNRRSVTFQLPYMARPWFKIYS